MKELFNEIFASISQNKLRTALTGFSVAWGILLLMILVGAGNGFQRGVVSNLEGRNLNLYYVYAGKTAMPYKGYQRGRTVSLKADDGENILSEIPQLEDHYLDRTYWGQQIRCRGVNVVGNVNGTTPSKARMENLKIKDGRYISHSDVEQGRKVVVISNYANESLFGKGESGVGERILLSNISFLVVGVIDSKNTNIEVQIPVTTHLELYRKYKTDRLDNIVLEARKVENPEQDEQIKTRIKEVLAKRHQFNPNDMRALYIYSSADQYLSMQGVFVAIKLFLWVVGLTTLLIGVVGVSNIMIVTVRERTFEFGIRKSLGATPGSLVRLVLIESVIITSFFGYVGLFLGVSLMHGLDWLIENSSLVDMSAFGGDMQTFKDPTVDISSALLAVGVLVVAGVIAGYIPARRAAKLKTIDAMRYNK